MTNELTKALLFLSMTSEAEEMLSFSLFLFAFSRNSSATIGNQNPSDFSLCGVEDISFLSSSILVKVTFLICHIVVKLCLYTYHCQFYKIS